MTVSRPILAAGLLLVVWVAGSGCRAPSRDRSATPQGEDTRVAPSWATESNEYERASDDPVVLRRTAIRLMSEIEALEADRDRLTEALTQCQDRNERFQVGLERAVDELNRRRSALPRDLMREIEGSRSAPPPSSDSQTSFSILGGPRISAIGSDVRVTGRVRNSGSAGGYATVRVELTLDGEYFDAGFTTVYVAARERQPWEVTLYNSSADGILRATATVD